MEADGVQGRYLSDCIRYADLINGTVFAGEQMVAAEDLKEHDSQASVQGAASPSGTTSKSRNRRKYNKLYRDLVKKVAFGINFAVIGIENQSEVHYLMPVRMMDYDVAEYKRQTAEAAREVRKQKDISTAEFLSGFSKYGRLKPCVTLVIYYGEKWDGSRDLHSLLDFTGIPGELKKYVANYPVNLICVRELENTDVFKSDLKLVFDFIRYSDDKAKLKKLVESNEAYKQMDEDAYDMVALYAKADELIGKKEYSREGDKVNMCKALEDMKLEERTLGHAEGNKNGEQTILKLVSMMFGAGESPETIKRISEDEGFLEAMRSKYLNLAK